MIVDMLIALKKDFYKSFDAAPVVQDSVVCMCPPLCMLCFWGGGRPPSCATADSSMNSTDTEKISDE